MIRATPRTRQLLSNYVSLRRSLGLPSYAIKYLVPTTGHLRADASVLTEMVVGRRDSSMTYPISQRMTPDFLMCNNAVLRDLHWRSQEPHWAGKASMSEHHRLLIPCDIRDGRFALNCATFPATRKSIAKLQQMRRLSVAYALHHWKVMENNVGLYFRGYTDDGVLPHTHLHVVDLTRTGPSFAASKGRNIPLELVIQVLEDEMLSCLEIK